MFDALGELVKVVKIASDVTIREEANDLKKLVSKVQAVIEFDLEGNILCANDLFLNAMGYTEADIKGAHHRMFMPASEADTKEYKAHWDTLREGGFKSGDFCRKHKDGSEVWVSAAYNTVYGPQGEPVKVIKYATDITGRVRAIATLRDGLAHLAQGNLNQTTDEEFSVEFEPLRNDCNTAVRRLHESLAAVVTATTKINSGTLNINNASNDLSRRTESQAAALEETSAAISQMPASVKSTAQTAQQTDDVVARTKAHAAYRV